MKKKLRKFVQYAFVFLMIIFAIGFTYQGISASKDINKYTPVGKMYEVYGNKMHIYTGGEGDSTVVFNAGWGTSSPYTDFSPLYEKLEKDTKYAVIDRFGYGYSEMTDRERDIDNIVDETRKLLQESGQKPPYILVGHSLASLETIRYAQRYPDEVKGIVLIDAGNPEYYSEQKPATIFSQVIGFLRTSGLLRLAYQINEDFFLQSRNNLEFVPAGLKELDEAFTLIKIGNKNVTDEMRQILNNAEKVSENQSLEVPLTVLTADSFGEIKEDWLESQIELATWSSSGKQIVVKEANHSIHQYQPDIIAAEILSMLKQ
ncbi:alpha/beta fold hydrolase [Peribacillus asahii]|uniref:alpha/beta fold hydrolase n=1 Tax=Peribacillus asahii TaxID=228899 RepID=UPI0037FCAEC6